MKVAYIDGDDLISEIANLKKLGEEFKVLLTPPRIATWASKYGNSKTNLDYFHEQVLDF